VPVTTSTPSPGNDALSAIVIPEGCTQTSEFTTGDGLLLFTCDGQPHTVHCSELPNGWRCECHTEFADYTGESKTYELDAPSAARAASVTALTCLGPDPTLTASPTDDTEEDCSSDQQADTSTCSLSEICRRSRTIDDVRVTFQDVGRTYSCTRDGSGLAACRCDDWVWKFADVQLEMGCGFVRTFCESETRTPIGEPDCTSVFEEAAADRCSVSQECKNAMQLSDGSIATVVLAEGASCDAYMTDRPSCSCTDRDGHLQRFEHSSSPLTLDACWEANDVCGQIAQYQPMGSYQCELESRSEAGTRCDRNLNCRQPATVGDTEVDLLGALTVHCDSSADSTWQCACTSNSTDGFVSNEAQVTVDATDASAACEAAETRCSDEVDVVFADGLPGN
jgi:hypothetical protein